MEITPMEILAAFEGVGERIDAILRQTDSLQLRALQLAEMLRSCFPSSPLYACLLRTSAVTQDCVLDQGGKPRDAWAEALRPDFDRLLGQGLPTTPQGELESKLTASGRLPPALKLSNYALQSQAIATSGELDTPARAWPALAGAGGLEQRGRGVLAVAIPKNAFAETLVQVQALLTVCSEQLALRLEVEGQAHRLDALQRELEGQSGLASTGELASPLTHEFNNFLNIVLLHVALLETEIPEKLRSELIELRRQGATMTRLVKQFQQHRRRLQLVPIPVDVNRVVQEAVGALASRQGNSDHDFIIKLPPSSRIEITGLSRPASVPLTLALAANLPLVLGSPADVKRLCTFLLTNATAAAGSVGGSVSLQTRYTDSRVFLRVEDAGPPISPELLHQVFEPASAGRPDTNTLELAACETLVRRLQGRIRCENRPEGGVAVTVELPRIAS
jgi:signal transduction histidine kinase